MERRECQEKKVSRKEMPKAKDAKRKKRQRKAAETTSVSRDSNDIRKNLSGEKSVSSLWLQSCRQEGLSRFRNVRSKPDQEKVAASDKDIESKKCQGHRLARDHGGVPIGSPSLPCLYRFFPLSKLPSPGLPGLYLYIYIYIHIYIYVYLYHQAKIRDHGSSFQDLLRRKTANGNIGTALLRKVLSRIVRDPFVAV